MLYFKLKASARDQHSHCPDPAFQSRASSTLQIIPLLFASLVLQYYKRKLNTLQLFLFPPEEQGSHNFLFLAFTEGILCKMSWWVLTIISGESRSHFTEEDAGFTEGPRACSLPLCGDGVPSFLPGRRGRTLTFSRQEQCHWCFHTNVTLLNSCCVVLRYHYPHSPDKKTKSQNCQRSQHYSDCSSFCHHPQSSDSGLAQLSMCGCHWEAIGNLALWAHCLQASPAALWRNITSPSGPALPRPTALGAWAGAVEVSSLSEGDFWSWPAPPCPVARVSRTSELSRR